jgi:flavin-dependent dehydrogenase
MTTCDVLIVGGGPAGSTCAWALHRAGVDVVVVDKAIFPRDKVCAGWITPQVVTDLRLDVDEYRRSRTFQPFTSFRVGLIGSDVYVDTAYDGPVSFGIRRCELDDYLLHRSGARLCLGATISNLRRDGGVWTINGTFTAPMLVGAGGHFCPVARMLNSAHHGTSLVVAQEAEFEIGPSSGSSFATLPERPELYFSPTFDGYGWCLRKENHVNIGFGHLDRRQLPKATTEFEAFLTAEHRIPFSAARHWKGHAYLISGEPSRRLVDDAVLLVGDAAGLASPQSGEGIRSAVESGLIAAATIIEAHGRYTRERLGPYEDRARERFGIGEVSGGLPQVLPRPFVKASAPLLLSMPWFVRHVLLDRWFLRAREAALAL